MLNLNIFKDKKKTNKLFDLGIDSIENNIIVAGKLHKMILKVSPVNGELLNSDSLEQITQSLQGALSSFPERKGIYIMSERVDISENIRNIDKKLETLDDSFKISKLKMQKEHLLELSEKIKNVLNFYFVIEHYNKSLDSALAVLSDRLSIVRNQLEQYGMAVEQLKNAEIKQLLYTKMNPEQSIINPYRRSFELENIYPQSATIFEDGKHLQVENTLYRHFAITKYPLKVDKYRWLHKIFQINENVTIAIILEPKNASSITKQLSKAVAESEAKENYAKTEEMKVKYRAEKESAKAMIERLGAENSNLYDTSILISVAGSNKEELETNCNIVRSKIASSFLQSTEIVRKGFEPYIATLPILANNRVTELYKWNMLSDDIASIIPFDSSEYCEKQGTLIGENDISNGLVIVDYRNPIYNNANMCVLAEAGAGKTFFLMCDIMRGIPYTDYTVVFDVKGDMKFPFGERYSFSPTSNIVVNPFHIRTAVTDNGALQIAKDVLVQKCMDLITFFRWIIPDMSAIEESVLDKILIKTYEKCGLTYESAILPKKFSTFSDMEIVMKEELKNTTSSIEKEIISKFQLALAPYITGNYSKMFNGQTNWNFNEFTVIDLSNVNETVAKPLYDILLKDVWNFCRESGTINPKLKSIYIDECHYFADPKNPQTLEFISTKLAKQGRGFGVRLVTATQNIPDFLSVEKYGQAILDNSFFKLFMRMGPSDIPVIQELFHFTESELKILKGSVVQRGRGVKGKGLFLVGGAHKIAIQTIASRTELEIIDPKQFNEKYGSEEELFYA